MVPYGEYSSWVTISDLSSNVRVMEELWSLRKYRANGKLGVASGEDFGDLETSIQAIGELRAKK